LFIITCIEKHRTWPLKRFTIILNQLITLAEVLNSFSYRIGILGIEQVLRRKTLEILN